jgi:DNA-binding NarL/FixJ family response regulator
MTGTVIKLLNADTCAFSQVEAEVLRRVSEGDKITSISSEMGLAEPIVMEYIRSILRKVRTRDAERMTGLADIRTLLEEGLSQEEDHG